MRVWTDLLGSKDSPYDIHLETKAGAKYEVRPPWPNLEVLSADVLPIEAIVQQVIRVRATIPEADAEQDLVITRLVARLQGGGEIELEKAALPTETIIEEVDITRCGACGGNIVPGDAEILETDEGRQAFHSRCVE
jgi:hypothetical protein